MSIKKKRRHREFTGILVIAFSILFALSIYHKNLTGLFGEILLHISTGMFGFIAYFLPPLIFVYGFLLIFYPQKPQFRKRLHLFFLLLTLVGAIFNTGSYNKSDYVNMSFIQYLKYFYRQGRSVSTVPYVLNGGVLGGLISVPLCLVFQKAGTFIVLGAFSIIIAMLITDISLKKLVVNTVQKAKTIKESTANMFFEREDEEMDEPVFIKELDEPSMADNNSSTNTGRSKIIDFPLMQQQKEAPKTELENQIPIQFASKKTKNIVEKKDGTFAEDTSLKDIRKITIHDREYQFPPFSCMNEPDGGLNTRKIKATALENAKKLEETLDSFGINAQIINVAVGPAFTRYELQPSPGVKVSRIVNLTDDIALSLAAQGIRIEAPIPGKAAVGIEVPNPEVAPIVLREVLETPDFVKFKSKLAVGLGKDITGNNVIIDLAKMPHMLIAGATGSGKSVCINSIIVSLLYKATPEEVKLLMIDPKVVELGVYNGIPHLLIPVVTDPSKAAGALQWAVQEMTMRYKLFADKGVRDLAGYNKIVSAEQDGFKLPQIVIIIDELADLMMVAPHDVEDAICRLAQMARAAGMHLIIATQRPSVNVITGVIKANIPSRISFAVSSQVDSRTILDMGGAEKLLGKGDMLYYPVGMQKPIRVKGCFITDKEIEHVVEYVKNQIIAEYDEDIIEKITKKNDDVENHEFEADELLPQAIEMVIDAGQASVSLIQRRLRVGYARAGRIIDQMDERGIISGFDGSKPRQVLITKEQWEEMKMNS
ncbi:MAG: DNA translocase FtsK [Clostridiaceae bacterium]|nr:DNA translocase FtsK [Clostridiaceae bacterium]